MQPISNVCQINIFDTVIVDEVFEYVNDCEMMNILHIKCACWNHSQEIYGIARFQGQREFPIPGNCYVLNSRRHLG